MSLQEVQAAVSGGAVSSAWISHIGHVNEVLTLVATLVAIVTGGWVLYDKIKTRRKERRDGQLSNTRKETTIP